MDLENAKVLSILGYIVILNEEIHSHQIKLLKYYLNHNSLDSYKGYVFDVINDEETKTDFYGALEQFQKENAETKEWLYHMCFALALIDCDNGDLRKNLDAKEKNILDEIRRYIYINTTKIEKQALEEVKNKKREYEKQAFVEKFNLDFEKVYRLARSDYEVWHEVINELVSSCDLLRRQIKNLDFVANKQLVEVLGVFKEEYDKQVFSTVLSLKENNTQKELASKSFSIALMGRTKAGKSTLHSLMCGEGAEFIGKGKQRTTRFNRVFSWKGIKIIDTPGIGAGEIDGEKDTEIACRVISQADIICFIVADDSITEEILLLIDRIAEYHKPMVVLLNHKDDINKKSHLKTFEKAPDLWLNTTNEQRLDGWIGRLERNANNKGYCDRLRVVPVFLLAAVKGVNEENELYLKSSNYFAFIDSIKNMIEANCMIYKSQTLLDEPSIQLFKANEILKSEKRQLIKFKNKIDDIRFRITMSIQKLRKEIVADINRYIDTEFEEFFTLKANDFVEECFEIRNVFEIQRKYEEYARNHGIEEKVGSVADEIIKWYQHELNGIVQELDLEVEYAHINSFNNSENGNIGEIRKPDRNIPFREIIKCVSMVLDIAACWAPVLVVISVPISFIGGFFKSSAQKQQMSKNQARDNFRKLIDYQKKDFKKKLEKELLKAIDTDGGRVGEFTNVLSEQVSRVINYINECVACIDDKISRLNTRYAIRLLENVCHNSVGESDISIKRDYRKNYFEITTSKMIQVDTKQIKKITGENIVIRRRIL